MSAATLEQLDSDLRPGLTALATNTVRLDEAVAALLRYSLLAPSRSGVEEGGLDDRLMSMHRLVQAATLDQLEPNEQDRWRQTARSLLDAALPSDTEDPANWPAYTWLLPHLRYLHSGADGKLWQVASFLNAIGDYVAARELWQQIVSKLEHTACSESQSNIFRTKSNLARTLANLGELVEARHLQERVLASLQATHGGENPTVIIAKHNLAQTLISLGKLAEARRLEEDVLTARRRMLGEDHPKTLIAQDTLADILARSGDLVRARRLHEQAITGIQERLGESHRITLVAKNNLTNTLSGLQEFAEARRLHEQVLKALQQKFGDDHPTGVPRS